MKWHGELSGVGVEDNEVVVVVVGVCEHACVSDDDVSLGWVEIGLCDCWECAVELDAGELEGALFFPKALELAFCC